MRGHNDVTRIILPLFLLGSTLGMAAAQHGPADFAALARQSGEPRIPNLTIEYLHPLGNPADARHWKHIIAHQTEGPAGSARALANEQARNPTRRGVMLWVETDGTVYWATAETAIPTHGDGANRNDNKSTIPIPITSWCGRARSGSSSLATFPMWRSR